MFREGLIKMNEIYSRIYKLDERMAKFTAIKCRETRNLDTCV